MGRTRRRHPKHLRRKLLTIRQKLGMSQTEMAKALGLQVHYSAVSNYELGTREPDLLTVLQVCRACGRVNRCLDRRPTKAVEGYDMGREPSYSCQFRSARLERSLGSSA